MIRTSMAAFAAACMVVALAGATPASAQKFGGGFRNSLGSSTFVSPAGSGPGFHVQNAGRPNGPQTRPPGWNPTFTDKAGPLNDYIIKNQPMSEALEPTFGLAKPKYDYPGRQPRPPRKPRTLSESGKKLNDHLSSSEGTQIVR